jgi:hypothetical protein
VATTKEDVRYSTFDLKPGTMQGKRVHLVHYVHFVHTTFTPAGQKIYAKRLDV